MNDSILTVATSGHITTVTLNSPGSFNALSGAMLAALNAALSGIAQSAARVVVLKAAGKAFCAGHDLKEMQGFRSAPDGGRAACEQLMRDCTAVMQAIRALPQPVIAEVQGIATAAGCQLVATCDLAIAAEDVKFGVNGVNIGLFCSTPMVALSRNIGQKRAFELLATGGFIPAPVAADLGLINRAVPRDQLSSAVQDMARTLAAKLPAALQIGKPAFYRQQGKPLDQAYEIGSTAIVDNLMLADTAAGMQAFIDKTPMPWDDQG